VVSAFQVKYAEVIPMLATVSPVGAPLALLSLSHLQSHLSHPVFRVARFPARNPRRRDPRAKRFLWAVIPGLTSASRGSVTQRNGRAQLHVAWIASVVHRFVGTGSYLPVR
jgi:hypothetical protein